MRKTAKPWYRKFNDTWYICLNEQQVPLGKHPEDAPPPKKGKDGWNAPDSIMTAFYRLMTGDVPQSVSPKDTRVVAILDLFLDYSQKHNAPRTYEWYRDFLQDFSDLFGLLKVEELKPFHVTRWVDAHPDWQGARWGAITAVKRAFNWAVDEGLIRENPIKKVKKPVMRRRERFITAEERRKIFDNYPEGDCFRDFLFALEHTGCRPGEASTVTTENVNLALGVWVFGEHKTEEKTGEARVVILTPEMVELTRRLMVKYPKGPLFRNEDGSAWNRNAIRCRFRRIRKKLSLGGDLVAYLYRHAVCTDLLESGTGLAQAAEILGHKDTKMIMRHYSKLRERREHLRDQLKKARGEQSGGPDDPKAAG
jgi:integrase